MDFLSDESWSDIRFVGVLIAAYACATILGGLLARWRRKQPLFAMPDWRQTVRDGSFFLALILMFVFQDVLERSGMPGWLALLVTIAAILAVAGLAIWRVKRSMGRVAAQTGRDNPQAMVIAPVRASREEVAVNLKLAALALGFVLVLIAPVLALLMLGFQASGPGNVLLLLACIAALAALIWAVAGRWPADLALSSVIEIAASPQTIFDTVRHVAGQQYYKGIVRAVEPVPGRPDQFLLQYHADEACACCGLPKHPDTPAQASLVEVLEERAPSLYRLRSWPRGANPRLEAAMDHEDESFAIEPLPGGGSRVTNSCRVERPRVWLAVLLKLGDPLGEHLRNLKAHIEGSKAGTVFEAGAARIAAARAAPRHCGCAVVA